MLIAFDASRVNIKAKTGVENYSTQLLHWLKKFDRKNQYILYTPKASDPEFLALPCNFKIKEIYFPRLWTQIRLSWQIIRDKPDILFIPSHVMPFLCRTKCIVTIHDVAFKKFPRDYSWFSRWYLDITTKFAVKKAYKIITISESTKNDLINIYKAEPKKIKVVYMGFGDDNQKSKVRNREIDFGKIKNKFNIKKDYLFYLGRIESKKNLVNLIKAFYELLAQEEDLQLVLAGKAGFGFEEVKKTIKDYSLDNRVIITGYISNKEKECLLRSALVFTFISLYEGFGIPVLEAMNAGVPCVLSRIPVFKELFSDSAILVDHRNIEKISKGILKVLKDNKKREELVRKGKNLVKKFSWERCARETLKVLTESNL